MARANIFLLAGCLFAMSIDSATAQHKKTCADFGHATAVQPLTDPPHCKCDAGYESNQSKDKCVAIVTMRAVPDTVIRAKTGPECKRDAGKDLQEALGKCKSPILSCLKSEGMQDDMNECVLQTLGSGIATVASIPDPTQMAKYGAALAWAATWNTCINKTSRQMTTTCGPTWTACQDGALATFKTAAAACPAK